MFAKFFSGIVHFLGKLFSSGKKSNATIERKDIIPAHLHAPITNDPGLKCPRCGNNIRLSIEILLSQQPIYCNSCFLKLSVDHDKSREALGALHKLNSDFQRANEMTKKSQ